MSVKKQNSQPKSDLLVITIIKNKVTFQSVSGAVDRKWVGGLFRKHFTVGIQLGAESLITLLLGKQPVIYIYTLKTRRHWY